MSANDKYAATYGRNTMNEYTPSTYQVREAYRARLRSAFVAGSSELEQEFDRWLSAHDAEVRKQILQDVVDDMKRSNHLQARDGDGA